jgi:hypothetical protein
MQLAHQAFMSHLVHFSGRRSPICIEVSDTVIDGKKIVFWDAFSNIVDHELIDNWIKKNIPANVKKTNTMNFHNAF